MEEREKEEDSRGQAPSYTTRSKERYIGYRLKPRDKGRWDN